MRSLVLFNNKGGVGKTTLTFNIAHMAARLGMRTLALDFDPQCNLSAVCLSEEKLVELWDIEVELAVTGLTVATCLEAVRRGKGDVVDPRPLLIADNFWIVPGHLALSRFEQTLAEEWPKLGSTDNERAMDVTTALDVLASRAASKVEANLILIDVGPSLGALNRAALLACDAVIFPVAPDLFSLQGLRNVGPTLREWRSDWQSFSERHRRVRPKIDLPTHQFQPIGYIVQQHLARVDRPVTGYASWAAKIPAVFHESILEESGVSIQELDQDPFCIGLLKQFASLVPIAQQARKPLFDLKMADGVGGGQIQSVARSRSEFEALVREIARRMNLPTAPPA